MKKLYSQYRFNSPLNINRISRKLSIMLLILISFHSSAQDIYEDFTSTSGWTYYGTGANTWRIGIPTNFTPYNGNNLMYISNSAANIPNTVNNYLNNSTSISHASKPFTIPTGNLYLTFNWRADAEVGYDYLKVWLVPAAFIPTANTLITSASNRLQLPPLNNITNFKP